jgi:hypothetical protein
MKKIAILLFALISVVSCSKDDAQTALEPVANNALKVFNKTSGTEIKDGDVLTFTSISSQGGANELKFYFKNTSAAPIKVKTKVVSFSGVPNTNGLEFCIGQQCIGSPVIGISYPFSTEPTLSVPANGTIGENEYKIVNIATPVSPATAVDYVFEAYQYDANGNEVGNKVRFTYKYQQ